MNNDFTNYVVTGVLTPQSGGKRFRLTYAGDNRGYMTAMGINLYSGSVWGVLSCGKRVLLKRV